MRIGVIGHSGMLGCAVLDAVIALHHTPIALTPSSFVYNTECIINCAGVVKGREEKTDYDMVYANAVLPHLVAQYVRNQATRIIHVSTDCVFSSNGPHDEYKYPQATDLYARSKLAGEIYHEPHLTIRTSFIGVGERGLLSDLQRMQTYHASTRQLWTGHTVHTVAHMLVLLASMPWITGLLHFPGDEQTRYDLVMALKQRFDLPVSVYAADNWVVDRRLSSVRWNSFDLPTLPSFADQLASMTL
jgi:dTDP-4-dehydrorhamnose reductase